jgi:S1-C subfamily serine protease
LTRLCAAASILALAAAGCRDGGGASGANDESTGASTVERTRVQVVEQAGGRDFDPAAIYDRLAPGVVTVLSLLPDGATALGGDGQGGLGSGFVVDEEGFVATNAHVVTTGEPPDLEDADEVFVAFADGNQVEADVVGTDPNSDVALLKVDPSELSLRPLELGSSADLTVGEPVAAIGSPFGERQSLSVGVISALDRDIESLTAFRIGNAIQTDAAINQGNSGGPLLDSDGDVIGINAQIRSTSGGGVGVGFAIPVNTVKRSIGQLRDEGEVSYAYLGVTSQQLYPQLAERLDVDADSGALVVEVEDGSPADDAGLEAGDDTIEFQAQDDVPVDGDVIVSVEGHELTQANDLADLIGAQEPGTEVRMEVIRGDDRREVTITLAPRPSRTPEG